MLIMHKNALQLGGSLVASSENPYFPASSIADIRAYLVWKSLGAASSETLTITLDRNYNSETLYLVLAGFDFSGLSAVTYQLGALPAVAITGYTNGVTFVTPILVPASNYNSLVLTFTKTLSANIVQVGKLYAGSGFDNSPIDNPDLGGITHTFFQVDNTDYSVGGQKYAEMLYQSFRGSLAIPYVTEQVMQDTIRPFLKAVGTARPWFLQIETDNGANPSQTLQAIYYVSLASNVDESTVTFSDTGYLWSLSLDLEEQL